MNTTKATVPADLRKQIVERIKTEGIPVPQAAEEHGLSPKTIYAWLARGATAPPTWAEVAKLKQENKQLLEMIGRLTLELSVAKKKN